MLLLFHIMCLQLIFVWLVQLLSIWTLQFLVLINLFYSIIELLFIHISWPKLFLLIILLLLLISCMWSGALIVESVCLHRCFVLLRSIHIHMLSIVNFLHFLITIKKACHDLTLINVIITIATTITNTWCNHFNELRILIANDIRFIIEDFTVL